MAVSIADGCERLEHIAQRLRAQLDAGKTPRVRRRTVRGFLKWFGYSRRGNYVVEQIRQCLDEHQLRTVPDFEGAWIDGILTFELNLRDDKGRTQEPKLPDPTIRLDSISTAHTSPKILAPEETIKAALSLMQMDGISHVIVSADGRSPMGVVSWRSIVDFLAEPDASLEAQIRECIEVAGTQPMNLDDPLFAATEQVLKEGYVLVRGEAGKIGGIVTTGDLAEKYERLALPFQMIGEVEGYLRRRIHSRLSQNQINAALANAHNRDIQDAHGLTFADYITLVGNDRTWELLELIRVDRKVLIDHLDWLRELRNDIMHFNVDEPRSTDLAKLKRLVEYFRQRLE